MGFIRSLVLTLVVLAVFASPVTYGGEGSDKGTVGAPLASGDKGTVGIDIRLSCHRGNDVFDIDPTLKGKRREQAILDFRACIEAKVDSMSDDELRINSAMIEEDRKSLGIDDMNINGYSIYWDALRKRTKKKAAQIQKKVPAASQTRESTDGGVRK